MQRNEGDRMIVDTNTLEGAALAWSFAHAGGRKTTHSMYGRWIGSPREEWLGWSVYMDPPERDEFGILPVSPEFWDTIGEVISEHRIELKYYADTVVALIFYRDGIGLDEVICKATGSRDTLAAARCFIRLKLGATVDVPDELFTLPQSKV